MAACGECGARKGHLDGCSQKARQKRGGRQPGRDRENERGGREPRRAKLCMQTDGGSNEPEHRGMRHVCAQDKGHGGSHRCSGCSHAW
jgi:hypothetical protein